MFRTSLKLFSCLFNNAVSVEIMQRRMINECEAVGKSYLCA
jgi:hypothetical protein